MACSSSPAASFAVMEPSIRNHTLKRNLGSQLQYARIKRRSKLPERRRSRLSHRRLLEIHIVEHIERLQPKLQIYLLKQLGVLNQRSIRIEVPRPLDLPFARGPERTDRIRRERSRVEKFLRHVDVRPAARQRDRPSQVVGVVGTI